MAAHRSRCRRFRRRPHSRCSGTDRTASAAAPTAPPLLRHRPHRRCCGTDRTAAAAAPSEGVALPTDTPPLTARGARVTEAADRRARERARERARVAAIDGVDSRAASNALLEGLRQGRFGPRAWGRFTVEITARSIQEARKRPIAFAEATAVHAGMAALAHPRGRLWIASSWIMTVTHLGMLEERRTMGIPNLLTVARANLPAAAHRLGDAVPVLALVTDFVDGKLARATGAVTRFGTQGDYLSDTALWTWFVVTHEKSRPWQVATFAAWALPVVALTAMSIAQGGVIDLPRSRWVRPAALMEVLIGGRVLARMLGRAA